MRPVFLAAIAALLLLCRPADAAKRDLKGITTGMTLEDAIAAGRARGGHCYPRPVPPAFTGQNVLCDFSDGFVNVMLTKLAKPARVYEMSFTFEIEDDSLASKDKFKASVFDLYALKDESGDGTTMSSGEVFRFRWHKVDNKPTRGTIMIRDQDLLKAEVAAQLEFDRGDPKP